MAQTLPIDLTDQPIAEGASRRLRFTIVDEDGAGLGAGSVQSLTYSLYAERDGSIINSRDGVDILSKLDANGDVLLDLEEEDNVIVSTQAHARYEYHVALFEWAYSLGSRTGRQTIRMKIVNLQTV